MKVEGTKYFVQHWDHKRVNWSQRGVGYNLEENARRTYDIDQINRRIVKRTFFSRDDVIT
jgi:hypothetical protein